MGDMSTVQSSSNSACYTQGLGCMLTQLYVQPGHQCVDLSNAGLAFRGAAARNHHGMHRRPGDWAAVC